ncbi:MAG: hypothetical protein ACFB0E_02110 [Leptolyngbyaceae cyanobacterium]
MASLRQICTGLLTGSLVLLGVGIVADSAIAQTELDPFESAGTDDDGPNIFGDSANPYELIHDAILTPTMSSEEFFQHQNRAIGTEAENFRLRQQEALRQQPAVTIEDSTEEISVDGEAL